MIIIRLKHVIVSGIAIIFCVAFVFFIRFHFSQTSDVFREISPSDKVFIIDPGHGGMDGGASSQNGTNEKNINLAISQKLNLLMKLYGRQTVMTRNLDESLEYNPAKSVRENKIADMKKRLAIVQQYENSVFMSIHLNQFEQSKYYGAQVFYSKNHADSKILAENIQEAMRLLLDTQNNRRAKIAPNSVYLMKNIKSPAVTIECGFLSNPEEAEKLQQDSYQKQIAISILAGYNSHEHGVIVPQPVY